jgi:hypothetical protein
MSEEFTEVTPQKSNRRTILIGGVSAVLLGCCALLAIVVVVLVIDPFGFNIITRLTGRYDAAATAMPPNTSFYAGLNLLNTNPIELSQITQPFIEAASDPDIENFEGAQEEFNQQFLSEFGIDAETDIAPWIGQYVGFGVTEFTIGTFGTVESVNWIIAAESRNNDAADEFILKLRDELANASGENITEQSYEEVPLYVMQGSAPDEQIAFGRSGGLVIAAANLTTIQAAIDAQNGDSLDETDNYRQIIGDLPRGRTATIYTSGEGIRNIVESSQSAAGSPLNPAGLPLTNFASTASSLSIVDAGLQLDIVSYFDQNQLTNAQQALLEASGQPLDTAAILPDQTVAYLSGQRLDLLWLAIREATGDETGFDESMDSFSREFGLNPSTILFPLLNGEWAIAVIAGQSGMLADELDVPLGLSMVIETDRPADMANTLDDLRTALEDQFLIVTESESSSINGYQVSLGEGLPEAFSFGLEQNYFYLTSSADTAVEIFSGGPALAENDRYQSFQSEFSRDFNLSFYLDVTALLGTLREGQTDFALEDFNDSVRVLEPLQAIALGNTYDNNIRQTQVIIFIETE